MSIYSRPWFGLSMSDPVFRRTSAGDAYAAARISNAPLNVRAQPIKAAFPFVETFNAFVHGFEPLFAPVVLPASMPVAHCETSLTTAPLRYFLAAFGHVTNMLRHFYAPSL